MTERDELADELADSIFRCTGVTTSSSKSMADELLAAGYRRPQQVTTVEELAALPVGSLLVSGERIRMYAGSVWRIESEGMIVRVGREREGITPFGFFKDPLPATVLHGGAE